MSWEKIIIALIPVPTFYLIYYRYFTFRPEYLKHMEAFLSGIAYAFLLMLVSPLLFKILPTTNPILVGFIKAALLEKIGACLVIIYLHRYYPNFSIIESILSAGLFGIGFSAVENVFYSMNYGFSVIILRILFSVPMHLTTCGMMGYYLAIRTMCDTKIFRTIYILKALIISILLHGILDSILLMGGYISFAAPVILILIVVYLEFLMAKSQITPPKSIINALQLRFEDWLLIDRQPRFERWILKSMGTQSNVPVHFFLWRPGFIRFTLVLFFIMTAMFGLAYRTEIMQYLDISLRNVDQIILLGNFPISIAIIIILVGAINPNFFKTSELQIPVISDVVFDNEFGFEETLVTYDITSVNCFLRTAEPFEIGTDFKMHFECSSSSSKKMTGEVVWENHSNPHNPIGTIIKIKDASWEFYLKFMIRYYLFRFRKGIIFNLKLPGFESTRKLFMRPLTVMEEDKIFKEGTIIFDEKDVGTHFYLLKKGKVSFYKTKENGERIIMDTIEDEQIFGEMAVVGNITRATTAVCESDCVVAVADNENLTALIRNNPDFALTLIETLAHRVQSSEKILFDNIHMLEKQLINKDNIINNTIMVGLLALSHSLSNDTRINLDINKLATISKDVNEPHFEELLDIFIEKLNRKEGSDTGNKKIIQRINDLYKQVKKNQQG